MTLNELANQLQEMYGSAPKGETAAMVHLFAIKFADQIRDSGISPHDIVLAAKIPQSYETEVNKGIKLAKYVLPR